MNELWKKNTGTLIKSFLKANTFFQIESFIELGFQKGLSSHLIKTYFLIFQIDLFIDQQEEETGCIQLLSRFMQTNLQRQL